jgi:hypothetical protein
MHLSASFARRSVRLYRCALTGLCLTACVDSREPAGHADLDAGLDAEVADASADSEADPMDAQFADAARGDARAEDGSVDLEAGGPDASERDASELDASELDASELDASLSDSGDPDATPPDASEPDAGPPEYPLLLSQTGLFADVANAVHAADVLPFEPLYKLWSDGAQKQRWIHLPATELIDSSDMDHWIFPVGTKAWKEFSSNDKRVETRMLHKVAEDRWVMIAYQWREDLSDADAVPAGVVNARGTQHDIPSNAQCVRCHGNLPDVLLGASAVQLSHALPGVTLEKLSNEGHLTHPAPHNYILPGSAAAKAALGYLHANCGHCHNPGSPVYTALKARSPYTGGPRLWETVAGLGSVEQTDGYASTVLQPNAILPHLHIIEPHDPDHSELVVRMSQRGASSLQMPPIATKVVDMEGLAKVRAWIQSLPAATVYP